MCNHLKFIAYASTCVAALVLVGCDHRSASNGTAETTTDQTNATAQTSTTAQTNNDSATSDRSVMTEDAVCQLVPIGNSGVAGTIHFHKQGDAIHVEGEVLGLSPGKHGFHVHEFGDLSDRETGKSAGGHFNPTDQPHGRPSDEHRHVGDLGNIEANEKGVAKVDMTDSVIQLNGPNSIVGRSIVVHAQADKFTQPSGDAGARVAFGQIEAAKE